MARILALPVGAWMGFVIALLLVSMATPALTAAGLAERRRQALIIPEIMAHQRIRGHLAVSALIAVLVAGLVLPWPF